MATRQIKNNNMEALYPKVRATALRDFLCSLDPDTILELWIKLCDYNHYDPNGFNWDDLENMVSNCETIAGITITHDYDDYGHSFSDFPLSDSEMDERIEGWMKE